MHRCVLMSLIAVSMAISVTAQHDKTFVFLHSRSDKPKLTDDQVEELMEGHLANIDRLAAEGKILSAGPFEGGGGIFVMSTGSVEEAQEWLSTDPGIQAQRWNLEIQPFTVSAGGICPATEPYEMVTYNFVRFEQQNEIANYKVNSAKETNILPVTTIQKLKEQDRLLLVCDFGQGKGGLLLYSGNSQDQLIEKDEAVLNGEINVSFKKLWIAKGSFCE